MFLSMVADKCLNAKDRKGWAFGNCVLMDLRKACRALLGLSCSTLLGAGLRQRLSPRRLFLPKRPTQAVYGMEAILPLAPTMSAPPSG